MYYGSGTVNSIVTGQPVDTSAYTAVSRRWTLLHVHSPDGSTEITWICELMSWPPCWLSEIQLH